MVVICGIINVSGGLFETCNRFSSVTLARVNLPAHGKSLIFKFLDLFLLKCNPFKQSMQFHNYVILGYIKEKDGFLTNRENSQIN